MNFKIINKSFFAYAYYEAKGDKVLFETKEQQKRVLGAYRSLERNNAVNKDIADKAIIIYLELVKKEFEASF